MSSSKAIMFTGITIVVFTIVHYILRSVELYPRQAVILPLYYPVGIVLGIITLYLLNHYFMNRSTLYMSASILVMILFQFAFAFVADYQYRTIIGHYYSTMPYSTLMGLPQYEKKDGNRLTIHKQMLKEGVFADSIGGGAGDPGIAGEIYTKDYTKPLVYAVNDLYIIFDWNQSKVIKIEKGTEIHQEAISFLVKELNILPEDVVLIDVRDTIVTATVKGERYDIAIFAKEGDFAYTILRW